MMCVFKKLLALILPVIIMIASMVTNGIKQRDYYSFSIDSTDKGKAITNVVSNVNVWEMGTMFFDPVINEDYNIGEFVEYIQLMQCTGGSVTRDLFRDPLDRTVLDDYDFSALIKNCRGILEFGAKPHLKLGSVPLKYSENAMLSGDFSTNVYPPDDYDVYYNYIAAMARALVDEFTADEVLTWRFGVMTEYENASWFMTPDKDPDESAKAYCKLYDYTVAALQDEIGDDVFVGAHSMTVTEGLWDEKIFINHCGKGTNYKTGEKGSRICFLSASFYDYCPGEYTSGKNLTKTIEYLQKCAKRAGLDNLIFGIDEGRILVGNISGADTNQLDNRIVGYTYQAAYDARLYKQLIDVGGDYFSSWGYLSGGLFSGYPSVSYHIAKNISEFSSCDRISVEKTSDGFSFGKEVDVLAGCNDDTIRIMAYNFKNELEYDKTVELDFSINAPQFDGKEVTITQYLVNDDANFFDEWTKDREAYSITDDCFSWSPEDPELDTIIIDKTAREIYNTKLRDKYIECSKLIPTSQNVTVEASEIKLNCKLDPNAVVFYEISAS